ncbi:hypothetical protein [Microviridae sp.]|nr:hypothetical protein [Microviridae sp.]UOF82655.1 hypothetical protein [Microviridae sp.]UOF82699.1 hypothetical protein [Microviridae sp.]
MKWQNIVLASLASLALVACVSLPAIRVTVETPGVQVEPASASPVDVGK